MYCVLLDELKDISGLIATVIEALETDDTDTAGIRSVVSRNDNTHSSQVFPPLVRQAPSLDIYRLNDT